VTLGPRQSGHNGLSIDVELETRVTYQSIH
jgi:hypothetical protein